MAVGPAPVANEHAPAFLTALELAGFEPIFVANVADLDRLPHDTSRCIVLLDVGAASPADLRQSALRCAEQKLPLIAIVSPDRVAQLDPKLGFDDFVLAPPRPNELLLLLASNPGRVYTRDALLSQIWGYDYLGGTRTVDVHVRRLRSKIEDADNSFIETVWHVGYRFRNAEREV